MWVERLELLGYKRLVGGFDFDPGLTLVVGPNEAGKSSLGDAFVRTIWGFEWSERRRRETGSPWERCRPWHNRPWRIVATIVDHDGRRLRTEWDFGEHKVRLLDAVTGEDLSAQVAARRGDVSLGSFLTGVSFADFWEVCLFDQHTLRGVRRSDSLVNALQRAVETVQTDVGVDDADGRLKDFLNTHVGARSDTYSPLATGPLQRDLNERARLDRLLEESQQEEAELARLAQDLRRRNLQRAVLGDEQVEVERGIRMLEYTDAKRAHDEALRQKKRAAAAPDETAAALDERLVTQAREHFGAVEQADRAIKSLEDKVAAAGSDMDQLQTEESDLAQEIEALDGDGNVDPNAERAVRDSLAALQHVDDEPTAPAPSAVEPNAQLARYRELRAELLELASRPEVSWDVLRLMVAGMVTIASVVLGAALSPIAFSGLVVALGLAATARSLTTGAQLEVRLRDEFGGERLDALERRAREEDDVLARASAAADAASTAASAQASRRNQIISELANVLDGVVAPAGAPLPRAEAYLAACGRRTELEQRKARLNDLRARIFELAEPARELAARRAEREARVAELQTTLSDFGIDGSDLTDARAQLDEQVRTTRALAEHRAEASGARQALETLLSGRSLEDLEQELLRAERRLREHEERHSTAPMADGDLASLRLRLASTERRFAEASELAAALQAQITERESRLPKLPEVREQLAVLAERIEERQLVLEAIRTAREALREAARQAHRNFAPHLQRALQRTLPRFTSNRYRDVTIADDLSISVIAPETGTQVPADCLSFGTQDQIYLVQRLEIAKMLIPTTGPVPLLLDEPFAEFDADRERAAVELLCEEAEERQVVVFSKDRRLIDLVGAVRGAPHLIELDGPTPTVVVA